MVVVVEVVEVVVLSSMEVVRDGEKTGVEKVAAVAVVTTPVKSDWP